MPHAPLWSLSATELTAALRGGSVSAVSVMESVLARVEAADPRLHAFVEVDVEGAMAAAAAADEAYREGTAGPLSGVPVSVKDLSRVIGMRTGFGRARRPTTPDTRDDLTVARLRAAGAILFGKTRTPERGYSYSSTSSDGVSTRTPWRLDLGAGGSSSGAAAAVAAGMGPVALGTDGAGSVRLPAALCGVVGLKPSFGRIPVYPLHDPYAASFVHIGPLTRTVADAALFLDVTQGADPRDPLSWSDSATFTRTSATPSGLRLAWLEQPAEAMRVDTEVAGITWNSACRLSRALGCTPPVRLPGLGDQSEVQRVLWECAQATSYSEPLADSVPEPLRRMVRRGYSRTMTELGAAGRARTALFHSVRTLFQNYDVVMTPTCPVAGWPHDRPVGLSPAEDDPMRAGVDVYPFNLTGNPAISLPAGWTAGGLPVGLQLVTGWRADLLLLEVAFAFERVQPWADHWPVLDETRQKARRARKVVGSRRS
ncbi:amidase [Actinophytocola oryzae]|uniref:amidase n=1 Tax=Actinophytocola oryzae TaxID=502181 RepID=UPI00141523C9|nr:amidase [Actinophytocola oryzae]